jgi:PAT family acetyl-CoA transporter-like MFS transporter 1
VRLAYEDLGRVLRIPLVQTLVLVLVTVKAGFAVVDGASGLMVQARGVDKSTIAFFDVVSTPIQLALQLAVARATAGPKPLTLFLRAFPIRALCGLLWLGYIYGMLSPAPGDGSPAPSPSNLALGLLFLLNNVHSLVQMVQFVTVSDVMWNLCNVLCLCHQLLLLLCRSWRSLLAFLTPQ